ncbi:homeobox domain-containing protein [Phthorimaea operculella]|nr:homeobox domain-containing protein [Phthorimaea operculella]
MLEKLLLLAGLTVPLSKTDENKGWENRPFTTVWPEKEQKSAKASEVKKIIKKKPRHRTAFTTEQLRTLEKMFNSKRYIDRAQREELAASLGLRDRCIKIWFQNRRMKEKRSSESSCDTSIESYSTADSPPAYSEVKLEQMESLVPEYFDQANTYKPDSQCPNYSTAGSSSANVPIFSDDKLKELQMESLILKYGGQENSSNDESQYQLSESQYQLPESQYQFPESHYKLPESQYQMIPELPESEYQLPNGYYGNHNQYYGSSNSFPPNNTFYNDANVYSTQYYPNSGNYNTEENIQPQNWASFLSEMNYY